MVDAHTIRLRRKSPFLEWCDDEGIPVVTGYGVEDLRALPFAAMAIGWEARRPTVICGRLTRLCRGSGGRNSSWQEPRADAPPV